MKEQIHEYLERLSNLIRNETRRDGTVYGLLPIQLEALRYLNVCNRYSDTLTGVAEYLGQTKGSVSQSLKILENKGFIKKQSDINDKRTVHLRVTKSGRKVLEELSLSRAIVDACDLLDKSAQLRLIADLGSLLRAAQQANGMKTFGVCRTCRHNRPKKSAGAFCALTQESLSEEDMDLICREHEIAA